MKKMLIANDLLRGGGVEKLMHDFVWAWHDRYEITVITDNPEEDFYELYPQNVRYITRNSKQKTYTNQLLKLGSKAVRKCMNKLHPRDINRIVAKEDYDLLIVMKEGYKMMDGYSYKARHKYVWVHTDYCNYNYTYDIFGSHENERKYMAHYDQVICVSEQIRDSILKIVGDPGNLLVKYNPIDTEKILEASLEPVVDVEKTENCVHFLSVGRLNYQKGFDLLLEACHMLEAEGYHFRVWIVGAEEPWGDEHHRLYRTVRRLGITSVTFLGGRKNPYKYMRIADWFLSSSIFEGYSLVSQEAAVLDLPLLLTACSGVRELIGDNTYGLSMEPSVKGIYLGMKQVLEHPELQAFYKEKIMERKSVIQYQERLDEIEELWKTI